MDLLEHSARQLLSMLQSKKVSAVEVMQATLKRISEVNSVVNAIVSLRDDDDLLSEATAADAAVDRGALHGLPIAIKDLYDAKGLATTLGSPLFTSDVATADGLVTSRLRAAGALIIGKTNSPEFGLGSHTVNRVFGATRNPYDLARSAGGSSGGAAVALSTRMLALADGSDMMGSLRNPAAYNNVYGLRPSWGLVPAEPSGDSFLHQCTTQGPMARSPADIAVLLEVQAGADWQNPHGRGETTFMPNPASDLAGKRFGWLGDWGGAYPMEPGILDICSVALQTFTEIGAQVEGLPPPYDASLLWDSWTKLRSWSLAGDDLQLYKDLETRQHLNAPMIWELEHAQMLTALQVHDASAIRSDWFRCAAAIFADYDALLLPSAQVWPFPIKWKYPHQINAVKMDTYHRWMEVVVPASLIGIPALNIPVGLGEHGLPMGLQVLGTRGADKALLDIGQAWHNATGYPNRHPPAI